MGSPIILSPDELAKAYAAEQARAKAPAGTIPAPPSGMPAPPTFATRLQKGLDWLSGKLQNLPETPRDVPQWLLGSDVKPSAGPQQFPVDPGGALLRSTVTGPINMAAHPQEHAPEIGATLLTLPFAGKGGAAVGALRAGLGSLAGSGVQLIGRDPRTINANDAWNAAGDLAKNAVGQYVGEKVFTGLAAPPKGSAAEMRAATFKREFPDPATAPALSASTIQGKTGNLPSRILGGIEKMASLFVGGSEVAQSADRRAVEDISQRVMGVHEPALPLPPAVTTGERLQGAVGKSANAAVAAETARVNAQRESIAAAAQARRDAIQAQLDAARAEHPDALTAPSGWTQPATTPPNPNFVKAQAAADAELKLVSEAEKRQLALLKDPTAKQVMDPAFLATITPILETAPEKVVKSIDPTDTSALRAIMRTTARRPQLQKEFVDSFMDTHIFRGKNGVEDPAGIAQRFQQAYESGALSEIFPKGVGERVIDRMGSLASILGDIKSPTPSYANKLRVGQALATAATGATAAATGHFDPMLAAKLAAATITGSSALVAALRAPTTRRILMDGLTDTDGARAATTIVHALRLANAKPQVEASHDSAPVIPLPPDPSFIIR